MVLSITLTAAIGAQAISYRLSRAALEQQRAASRAAELAETAAGTAGEQSAASNGADDEFTWTARSMPAPRVDGEPIQCRIAIEVVSRRSARRVSLDTVRFCGGGGSHGGR
jgi:Tfp pilus assembly protein PilV